MWPLSSYSTCNANSKGNTNIESVEIASLLQFLELN